MLKGSCSWLYLIKCSSSVTCHIFTKACKLLSNSLIASSCSLSKFPSLAITLLSSSLQWNYWGGLLVCAPSLPTLLPQLPGCPRVASTALAGKKLITRSQHLLPGLQPPDKLHLPKAPTLLCLQAFATISPTRMFRASPGTEGSLAHVGICHI